MRTHRLFAGALSGAILSLLCGCSGNGAPVDTVEFRSPDLESAIEYGLAITPLLADAEVPDFAEATASLTNAFHSELRLVMPDARLVGPREVISRLDLAGPDAYARLRAIRRKLHRNAPPEDGHALNLARDIQHRYAVIGWMHEKTTQQDKGGGYDTAEAGNILPVDVLQYRIVSGQLTAAVIDLETAEVLWRGRVDYESEKYETGDADFEAEVDWARSGAAARMAGLIADR